MASVVWRGGNAASAASAAAAEGGGETGYSYYGSTAPAAPAAPAAPPSSQPLGGGAATAATAPAPPPPPTVTTAYPPLTVAFARLVNLTGTTLSVYNGASVAAVLTPSGFADVTSSHRVAAYMAASATSATSGVAVPLLVEKEAAVVAGLPAYAAGAGVLYVVTTKAADALTQRPDIARPGPQIRNGTSVIGCRGLVLNVAPSPSAGGASPRQTDGGGGGGGILASWGQ